MKRAYNKNNLKNFKITKEIEMQIMDLADVKLKGEKKHFIEKLVAENSNAENLYKAYLQTSMFEVNENKNGEIKTPEYIKKFINEANRLESFSAKNSSDKKNKNRLNKISSALTYLKKTNEFIKSWFDSLFIPKLASICLIFYVIGQISYEDVLTNNEIKFRSSGSNVLSDFVDVKVVSNNIILQYGEVIKNNSDFYLNIISKEPGKLKVLFEEEQREFLFDIKKNTLHQIFKGKNFTAQKPSISFTLTFKTMKKTISQNYFFAVK